MSAAFISMMNRKSTSAMEQSLLLQAAGVGHSLATAVSEPYALEERRHVGHVALNHHYGIAAYSPAYAQHHCGCYTAFRGRHGIPEIRFHRCCARARERPRIPGHSLNAVTETFFKEAYHMESI